MKTYSVITSNAQADFDTEADARQCFSRLPCAPGETHTLAIVIDGDIVEELDSYTEPDEETEAA